jgi:glucokinase
VEVTAKRIHEAAEAGDVLALEIILETARYLGIGITTLLHTIDPAAVVLGGAMNFGGRTNKVGQQFLDRIKAEVAHRAFPVVAQRITIDFASLGSDAGFIGAAGVARLESRAKSQESRA